MNCQTPQLFLFKVKLYAVNNIFKMFTIMSMGQLYLIVILKNPCRNFKSFQWRFLQLFTMNMLMNKQMKLINQDEKRQQQTEQSLVRNRQSENALSTKHGPSTL